MSASRIHFLVCVKNDGMEAIKAPEVYNEEKGHDQYW